MEKTLHISIKTEDSEAVKLIINTLFNNNVLKIVIEDSNSIKTYKDIKSHQDACKVLEKDPAQSPSTDQMITDICNAMNRLNGNWKADFSDKKQRKWRPFFIMDGSGFRFVSSLFDYSYSGTDVGSRLCHYVGTEAEAVHLGTQFLELHKAHYLGE
jgi:hypothetical protein